MESTPGKKGFWILPPNSVASQGIAHKGEQDAFQRGKGLASEPDLELKTD